MNKTVIVNTTTPLVEVRRSKPFTTSRQIAEACGRKHKNTIALVRKFREDFENFGRVAFETRPFGTSGGDQLQELVILNEEQAAYLITLFRNTPVVREFKLRLVKAFSEAKKEISRRKELKNSPQWQQARLEAKNTQQRMLDTLRECREEQGKVTEWRHYRNEEGVIAYAMTGKWNAKLNRDAMSPETLRVLERVERRNTALIELEGSPAGERKERLRQFALEQMNRVVMESSFNGLTEAA